jgi:hypothetical protein
MWPKQAFRLSVETIEAVSQEEVDATYADMEKLGIAQPPYAEFDIIVPAYSVMRSTELLADTLDVCLSMPFYHWTEDKLKHVPCGIRYHNGAYAGMLREVSPGKPDKFEVIEKPTERAMKANNIMKEIKDHATPALLKLLVVLLATKNAEKTTRECKSARLGIGKGKHAYTTTISVGAVTETVYETSTNLTNPTNPNLHLRPHLRRGHGRAQHYGPNNNYIKHIFIQHVFVNADAEWIDARTAYNVSMKKDKEDA